MFFILSIFHRCLAEGCMFRQDRESRSFGGGQDGGRQVNPQKVVSGRDRRESGGTYVTLTF